MPEEKVKKQKPTTNGSIFKTGKRKEAIARIKIAATAGIFSINEKPIDTYFAGELARLAYFKPFHVLGLNPEDYTVSLKVVGGGKSGQLDAVSKAIAKGLLEFNPEYRPRLKKARLLHRDPRVKERRKYGLAGKARGDKQRPKR